jgi:hypothetical protein
MAQVTTAERKSIFSLFNLIALIVLGVGVYITYLRFTVLPWQPEDMSHLRQSTFLE